MGGRLAELSLRAIRHAAACPSPDPAYLARRLYGHGRIPRTTALEEILGPGDDPMVVLDLLRGNRTRTRIEADYEATNHPGWYGFRRWDAGDDQPAAKLYVSPHPRVLGAAFPRIAELFVALEVPSFKIGRGIAGLLRPDKIVAYFTDISQLSSVGTALTDALQGLTAQGVPFTGDLGGDGMVSWGIDPPSLNGEPQTSWRAWICDQLAAAIVEARQTGGDPVRHAEARLARYGIVQPRPC